MDNFDFPLGELDSNTTPITGKKGKEIEVNLDAVPAPVSVLSRPQRNAFALLMEPRLPTFLPVPASGEAETQPTGTVQEHLCNAFPVFYADI